MGNIGIYFKGLLGLVVLIMVSASVAWTTWTARHILQNAHHRKIKEGEETSLRLWMSLSNDELDSAAKQLKRTAAVSHLAADPHPTIRKTQRTFRRLIWAKLTTRKADPVPPQ